MIDKTYQPSEVEGRIYRTWEQAEAFKAGRPERAGAEPYSIVIPPPNVTGSLHMGHALNNTLQDILARFERMRGKDVLWQPGTDHAGIATQMVVERQLAERGEKSRREMGREAFLKRVWEWKAESGGTIVNQLKRLGASCDWSRERFTMDEGLSRAVLKVFVTLYNEGLIYKDKRLVNWDPKLLTAISDLEVVQVETKGHLWHLRYPIEGRNFDPNDPSTYIVVATTRPETMLGDTAVAVHPDDARYKALVGKNVILPLVGRCIPIIADEYSDPEKGSGAVKITPAHDFNDFEVGKRHNLPIVNVLTVEAKLALALNVDFLFGAVPTNSDFAEEYIALTAFEESATREEVAKLLAKHSFSELAETVGSLDGIDRFAARKQIVARLEAKGLVEKIDPHTHAVPHGDRSNVVIEPYLTEQWYVNAKKLAEPAVDAVRVGKTQFIPKNWESTYFNWMDNIQPWCISRQLWWGHQIPCWYGAYRRDDGAWAYPTTRPEDAHRIVCPSEVDAIRTATEFYGASVEVVANLSEAIARTKKDNTKFYIWRDEDVLDTWFSSALWPFSTLGWPDETKELKRYYPTSALVTGFDIIFFWVARMMMMGLHFMHEIPFHDVYIHALVRDASGAKMSKSKGNVIDPLALIDEYGADALRFTLAAMAAQGRDIKLSTQRVEGYRNFATKLWNAARFAEMNECTTVAGFDPRGAKQTLNRWIAHETAKAAAEVTEAIVAYRFNDAAGSLYRFVWNIYCDWYLELAKPLLTGADEAARRETRAMVAWARDEILKLLHPFMPFVTEELWTVTAEAAHGVSPSPTDVGLARHPHDLAQVGQARLAMGEGREGGKPQSPPSPSLPHKGGERSSLLALSEWPSHRDLGDARAEAEIGGVIDLITAIRSVRAEMNVNVPLPLVLAGVADHVRERIERWSEFIKRMARVSDITQAASYKPGTIQLVVRGETIGLALSGLVDLAAERARLAKEMAKADADIKRAEAKLANEKFVANAPEEVVEEEKEKREEAAARRAKLAEALERLKDAG
jgi:valyl-tRNA synthetase